MCAIPKESQHKKQKYNPNTALKLSKRIPGASNSDNLKCKYCGNDCWKSGKEKNGAQRYKCKNCKKHQQAEYAYNAYDDYLNDNIIALVKEGVSMRGIARLLGISQNTLTSRIKEIASNIKEPALSKGKTYEMDELRTYLKKSRHDLGRFGHMPGK